jgi:ABC-2 type transport system permease protein
MAVAFVVGAVAAGVLSFQGDGTMAEIAGWLATTWAALSLVIGPQWIRNDLRSDLLKLDLLRSYPLPGRSVVAAETAASTLVLTCMQLGLLLVAYIAFIGVPDLDPPLDIRTAVLAAAAVCLPGINFRGMLIHNGTALLFPAWVHLGSNRPGGVEALGQNMLMIVAYAALLALALVVPAAIAAGLGILLERSLGWWAAVPAALVLLVGIAAESVVLVRRLGGVFERMEPMAGIMT